MIRHIIIAANDAERIPLVLIFPRLPDAGLSGRSFGQHWRTHEEIALRAADILLADTEIGAQA